MTDNEKVLLLVLKYIADSNTRAVVLQSFIAEHGPLSEEAGAKVREVLKND
jgi:hypothetical protein